MTIEKNLRKLRLDRGMTQEQVAQKLGVTRQALSSYESGRTRPDIDTLMRLSEIYETDLEGLVRGQDRLERDRKKLKLVAAALFAALVLMTAVSSALLWSANRFYPMPADLMSEEGKLVFEKHRSLIEAWEGLDGIILQLGRIGLGVLFLAGEGSALPMKQKAGYGAALAAGLLLASAPFGLTDPVFTLVDYLIVPGHTVAYLLILLAACLVLELLRKLRRK